MMHMTFYWGKKVTLLVDSWKTDSLPSYGLTLLALFLFSVFYQYMENRRLRFKLLSIPRSPPSITTPLLLHLYNSRNSFKFASALLFGINSAIGYLLMLAIMSYNVGVFVAIVLGLAIGYLIFRSDDEQAITVQNLCECT